jgi:hypothetical protein
MSRKFLPLALMLLYGSCGCVQRTMTLTTDPPGAMVWMNNQELGRTPVERDFTWYGTYDVQVRKEGYETLDTKQRVIAPIWQWPPLDLFAELWPGHAKDLRHFHYQLQPSTTQPAEPDVMLANASELREHLESSKYTRSPTTHTAAATNPSTAPSTQPSQ